MSPITLSNSEIDINSLSMRDLLLQFPTLHTQISNRDFDCYYNYKHNSIVGNNSFLYFLDHFIHFLYKSGLKCKQTSITYKFHSFPIIKIYSYIVPANNLIEYNKVNNQPELSREYKLVPCFSPLATHKFDYYLNFFIINGVIHYGLKRTTYLNDENIETKYLYGREADEVIEKVSADKNYNYLSILKTLKLPEQFFKNIIKFKAPIISLTNTENSIVFEINNDLSKYDFYSYYNEDLLKSDLLNFLYCNSN